MGNNSRLNVDSVPKEVKLLLEFLKKEDFDKFSEKWSEINWELFLKLVIHHRVYPVLAPKLKKVASTFIPERIYQVIDRLYRENTFRMLTLSAEMESLNQQLTEQQVRLLFLKGPFLGTELYGDLSLRTSGDLDVMISLHDLDKVDKFLVDQGYEKDDYIQTVLSDWKWRHHHFTYFHPKRNSKLEVHWRLNPGPGKEPSFDELWNRRKKGLLANCSELGNEDLFLFLVSHGARHGWSRLRWLVDIDQLLQKELNWHFLNELLKKYHYHDISAQAMILSSQLLGSCIPQVFQPFTNRKQPTKLAQEALFYLERMVNLHSEPIPEEVAAHHKRHLFSLMSVQQKILFLGSFFYPYPADAETLPLPKALHFLYFPLRPFLWMWRRTRNHAIS